MNSIQMIGTLKRMDYMINSEATGSPEDFARRLAVSKRSLFNYLSLLKELGGPIEYKRGLESYVYMEDGRFIFGFKK